MKRITIITLIGLLLTAGLFAAAKADKDRLIGYWYVAKAVYTTGEVENSVDMNFTFDVKTLKSSMTNVPSAYTVDETAKKIKFTSGTKNFEIVYKITSDNTMTFSSMIMVNAGKTNSFIGGKDAIFATMDLKKK